MKITARPVVRDGNGQTTEAQPTTLTCVDCLARRLPAPTTLQADTLGAAIDRTMAEGWMLGGDGWHCPGHTPKELLVTARVEHGQQLTAVYALDSQGQVMQPAWRVYTSFARFDTDMVAMGYVQAEQVGHAGAFTAGGRSGRYALRES